VVQNPNIKSRISNQSHSHLNTDYNLQPPFLRVPHKLITQ